MADAVRCDTCDQTAAAPFTDWWHVDSLDDGDEPASLDFCSYACLAEWAVAEAPVSLDRLLDAD